MMSRPRVAGIIPARYGSTRFPGKMLVPVSGRPLVLRVLDRARRATCLDEVAVATDDERIFNVVEVDGGQAVMTQAEHLSGTDRVAEAAEVLEADIVVNIQGDELLIEPDLIDAVANALVEEPQWDMATAATPILSEDERDQPSVVKVVVNADGAAMYFSRSVIPHDRDGGDGDVDSPVYWRHLGLYSYRIEFLQRLVTEPPSLLENLEKLEQLRALHIGARIKVLSTRDAGMGVDVPEDVVIVEAQMRERGMTR